MGLQLLHCKSVKHHQCLPGGELSTTSIAVVAALVAHVFFFPVGHAVNFALIPVHPAEQHIEKEGRSWQTSAFTRAGLRAKLLGTRPTRAQRRRSSSWTSSSRLDRSRIAQGVVLIDFSSAVSAWFNNVRVPAALLATAAMRMLFIADGTRGPLKTRLSVLRGLYFFFMSLTIISEIGLVYVATLAVSKALTKPIPPAASALLCLMDSFEMEYLTCRSLMLLGTISLLWGLSARSLLAWAEVSASPESTRSERLSTIGMAITFLALPLAFIGYSDANAPTVLNPNAIQGLHSYAAMVRRSMLLLTLHLLQSPWGRIALVLFATSALCCVSAITDALSHPFRKRRSSRQTALTAVRD